MPGPFGISFTSWILILWVIVLFAGYLIQFRDLAIALFRMIGAA